MLKSCDVLERFLHFSYFKKLACYGVSSLDPGNEAVDICENILFTQYRKYQRYPVVSSWSKIQCQGGDMVNYHAYRMVANAV